MKSVDCRLPFAFYRLRKMTASRAQLGKAAWVWVAKWFRDVERRCRFAALADDRAAVRGGQHGEDLPCVDGILGKTRPSTRKRREPRRWLAEAGSQQELAMRRSPSRQDVERLSLIGRLRCSRFIYRKSPTPARTNLRFGTKRISKRRAVPRQLGRRRVGRWEGANAHSVGVILTVLDELVG